MPPDISSSNDKIDSSDLTASNKTPTKGGSGSNSDSGYFSEEPILESNKDGSSGIGGGSAGSKGQTNIGNGSNNNKNEFGGNGSGGKWGMSPDGGKGSDVADGRRKNFQETSNLKDIHFNFDQYVLDSNSQEVLKQNASYLKQNPGVKIEVQGHCDERGTNNYNIALGERRAHTTKRFLVAQGIDSSRINIISYGEEKPVCFDSNEGCWFQNRRAHFMLAK